MIPISPELQELAEAEQEYRAVLEADTRNQLRKQKAYKRLTLARDAYRATRENYSLNMSKYETDN